jgi:hypothetical protein
MHLNHPARLLACAAFAGSAAFAVVIPGSSAFASSVPSVSCTTVGGNATTTTLSGCTGTGASLSGPSGVVTVGTSTESVAWVTGKTSVLTITNKIFMGKKDKCPAKPGFTSAAEVKLKGKVTGGTIFVGGKVKGQLCAYTAGSTVVVTNFPGKPFSV